MTAYAEYREEVISRYWAYQRRFFPQVEEYFDQPFNPNGHPRPPVFLSKQAWHNVLFKPSATQGEISRLLSLVPERHKWFRSMNSSQALAQSVLGDLAIYNHLGYLAELTDDAGDSLLGNAKISPNNFKMECQVTHLGEPTPTSLDGFISGEYQVALECKFTEVEVGACSRPLLKAHASNYKKDFCNGSYTHQLDRKERCSLTEVGVSYWKHVPKLFNWQDDIDILLCPLHKNYQLVRNILAVCVRPDGTVSPGHGHVVLIYDERNPAFQAGGNGYLAFYETRLALKNARLLRKCSWQRIVRHLKDKAILPWLTEQLEWKYGLR
jgi:hypothetical protein